MMRLRKQSGFSLVELMIVMVMIGILATVAVPIYTNNVKRARMSEADAALGTLRTELRLYRGENGSYPVQADAAAVVGASWNYIATGELTGKNFADASYTYKSADGVSFTLTCAKGSVLNSDRTLDQVGTFAGGI